MSSAFSRGNSPSNFLAHSDRSATQRECAISVIVLKTLYETDFQNCLLLLWCAHAGR